MQQQQQHVADDEDDDELMTDYSDTSQAITELKQHSVLLSPTTTDDTDDMDLWRLSHLSELYTVADTVRHETT